MFDKFVTEYFVFLKQNLKIESQCGSLKILGNRCGPKCRVNRHFMSNAHFLIKESILQMVDLRSDLHDASILDPSEDDFQVFVMFFYCV